MRYMSSSNLFMYYWPTIEYTKDGRADKQWTYDSCLTMEEAIKQIQFWAKDPYFCQITRAYVDVDYGHYGADDRQMLRKEIDLAKHGIVLATPPEPFKPRLLKFDDSIFDHEDDFFSKLENFSSKTP